MKTKTIEDLLHETAEEIRRSVASQLEAWQALPYWTLESEGRGGWADNWGLPYRWGMFGVDKGWPHYVFVECATGYIVVPGKDEMIDAPDEKVVGAYIASSDRFDGSVQLAQRVTMATNGQDTYNKERNDQQRDELRKQWKVPLIYTASARPIKYSY